MRATTDIVAELLAHTNGRPLQPGCLLCDAAKHILQLDLSRTYLAAQVRWLEQQQGQQ